MAKNIRQGAINAPIVQLGAACTFPAIPVSGDPCWFGDVPGVAEIDEDANGITTLRLDCIAELVVQGVNGAGNVAVTAGDVVYATQADPLVLSKIATGKRFGVAYGNALVDNGADTRTGTLVVSGVTTTKIRVLVGH